MSSKPGVMLQCHNALLHRPSTPLRDMTQSALHLGGNAVGSFLFASHLSPDFQIFHVGDSHGLVLPLG